MAHVSTADLELAVPRARARAEAGRWEMRAAALCFAQFSEPFFGALAQSQGLTDPPGYARLFFAPVYAFIAWAIWRDRAKAFAAARAAPLLMALLALVFVSALWSIDSGGTLRRSVWLALTTAFALYLAWRYDWARLLRVIAGGFAVLIAGSFLVGGLMPSIGRMATEHPGAWCGLWTHKNTLGGLMAIAAPLCFAASLVNPNRKQLWRAATLGALVLVLLSTSKTALLAAFIGFAVIAAAHLIRRGPMQALVVATSFAALAILIVSVFLLAPQSVVAALGRDLTFTGRTDIWQSLGAYAAQHPWLGFGYYAFWLDPNGPAYWVRQAVRWDVASAHNGWLELTLGLGRIGVALFVLQFVAACARAAGVLRDPRAGLWTPAFLIVFGFYSMSESHILQANDLFWLIYVAAAARLALDAREKACA